jgi:hypothetical protein
MRHLGSIVLSLVLAPIIYVLVGVGFVELTAGGSGTLTSTDYAKLAIGGLALIVAGLLFALLTMSRLSPLGPVLAGLSLLVIQVWALVAQESFLRTMPRSMLGVQGSVAIPAGIGVALLLAVPLLATIVSPRRWRRSAQPAAPAPYGAAAQPYGYQPYAPSYPPPPSGPAYPGAPGPQGPTSAPPAPPWPIAPQSAPPAPPQSAPPAPPPQSAPPAAPVPARGYQPPGDDPTALVNEPDPPTAPVHRAEPPVDPDSTRKL